MRPAPCDSRRGRLTRPPVVHQDLHLASMQDLKRLSQLASDCAETRTVSGTLTTTQGTVGRNVVNEIQSKGGFVRQRCILAGRKTRASVIRI
ncbi:unnamed protein product, partial [Nesidiocoris tenuis]